METQNDANVPEQQEEEHMMGLYDDNDIENEGNDSSSNTKGKSKDQNGGQAETTVTPTTTIATTGGNNDKSPTMESNNASESTVPKIPMQKSLAPNQTSSDTSNTIKSTTRSNITTPSSKPTASQNTNNNNNKKNEVEALNDEIATLLLTNKITLTTSSKLQSLLRENVSLKEKIAKLKTLLARSSKVSKETKQELEKAQREVLRLTQRVESLANRPTHMDLLADFETNFDRALMSLHSGNDDPTGGGTAAGSSQQSGGEDTMPQVLASPSSGEAENNVSTLLLSELSQTKSRMENLEALNAQLVRKATKLGKENEQCVSQMERQNLKMSNLQLELRMAKMETENATREVKAKAASLSE